MLPASQQTNTISQAQERNKRRYACRTNRSVAPAPASKATAEEKGKSHVPPVLIRPDGTIQSLAPEPYSSTAEKAVTELMPSFTPALESAPRFIGQPTTPPAAAVNPTAAPTSAYLPAEASQAGPSAPRADRHAVQPGDFVMVKKHEKVCKSGDKHGKLADKVHGPHILHYFTDSSQQVAVLQDAADNLYKHLTADPCIYGTR